MRLKKTKFSNIAWCFYALTALVFSNLVLTRVAEYFYFDKGVGLILTAALAGLSVLFVMIVTASKRKKERESGESPVQIGTKADTALKIVSLVAGLLIIVGGVLLRIRYLEDTTYMQALADKSMIPFYPSELSGINGIAEMYYYSILEFLFFVFGNFGENVLILNIVLIVIGAIIIFFAVKGLLGRIAAVISVAMLMLSPFSVKAGLESGPELMGLILAALSLLFIAELIPCDGVKVFPALFAGVFIGISVVVDFSCAALLLCAVLLFIREYDDKESYGAGKRFITLGILFASVLAGAALALLIYSGMSGKSFGDTVLFLVKSTTIFNNKVVLAKGLDLISGSIITLLLLIGITAGFLRKKIDQGAYLFLILFGVAVINCLGGSSFLNGQGIFVLVLIAAFGGHSIENLILRNRYFEKKVQGDDTKSAKRETRITEADITPVIEKKETVSDKVTVSEEITVKSGEPLDNPLPVPEHKARKTVDYDYYVSENADYDY